MEIREANEILVHEVAFRGAQERDLPALRSLYAQLIPDEHPEIEDMRCSLRDLVAHPEAGLLVVGTVGDRVVCTCQIILYSNLVRAPRRKAEIDSVVVDSAFRGLGIGRSMMIWAMEWLAQRDCSRAIVATAYERDIAHRMYAKLGYVRNGYSFIYSFPR